MIIWFVFVFMILAALGFVLLPLLQKPKNVSQRMDYNMAVYTDQLNEIEKDRERNLLTDELVKVARTEIHRRILSAGDVENTVHTTAGSPANNFILAFFIFVAVTSGTCLFYGFTGSPSLPAKPYATRQNDPDFVVAMQAEKLSVLLESHPDAKGYQYLAESLFILHRYDQAAGAYRKIIAMDKSTASTWSSLGEMITLSQDNIVTSEARDAFIKALQLDSKEARARFYLGVWEMQNNEPRYAVAIWRDLEKDTLPEASWMKTLQQHIAIVSEKGGFSAKSVLPESPFKVLK